MRTEYKRIPGEMVMQAVEDLANGNRLLISRAYIERRLAEIRYNRDEAEKGLTQALKDLYLKRLREGDWK